jgi:peptide deformylase
VEVLKFGNEILRQKSEVIRPIDNSWKKLADEMIDIVRMQKGIGLAGPQVGVLKRIFVVALEKMEPLVFINPAFVETSQELTKYEEGCLSIPEVYGIVNRPSRVKVQAWNAKGRPFTMAADAMLARVIQHEYDHLEGILFVDKLPQLKRERVLAKYEKLREKREGKSL